MWPSAEKLVKQEGGKQAAGQAGNSSELQLTLGDVPNAVHSGKLTVGCADHAEEMFWPGHAHRPDRRPALGRARGRGPEAF